MDNEMRFFRKNEQAKYGDILSEQMDIKHQDYMKRWKMDPNIKKMNYQDLQDWKDCKPDIHNNALPGDDIDHRVAAAVVKKFNNTRDIGEVRDDAYDDRFGRYGGENKYANATFDANNMNAVSLSNLPPRPKPNESPNKKTLNRS